MRYLTVIKKLFNRLVSLDIKTKQLTRNIVYSFLVKGLSMFVSLFTIPAYMNYFSDQSVLGVWFTAISVLTWILNFDLGIGNGLRNHLVGPIVKEDKSEIKKNISAAYISIGGLVVILTFISIFLINIIDWNTFFNISNNIISQSTLQFMVIVLVIGILIQFWLKLINSILYALQLSAIPNLLTLISSILILFFTLTVNFGNIETNIKFLSLAYMFSTNIPILITTIILFNTKLKGLFPRYKYYSFEYSKKIVGLGGIFFYLQMLTMIMFSTNEFFITWIIGPNEVVEFQIYNRLFSVFATIFSLSLTPVWSAVTEAIVKQDYLWVKNLNKNLNKLLMLAIPFELLMIVFMPAIIDLWLGNQAIEINFTYSLIFGVYYIFFMKVKIDTAVIAGFGKLKTQSIALTITVLLKVILTYLLTYLYPSWISIVLANLIALVPYIVIEYFDIQKKIKSIV